MAGKEARLGARISLADRMSSGILRAVQRMTTMQSTANKLNQTTQKMGQTMHVTSNRVTSGMNIMGAATASATSKMAKIEGVANKAAEAADRSGSAAERAARKWKMFGEQHGGANKRAVMMNNLDHASGALQSTGLTGIAVGGGIAYGMANAVKTVSQFDDSMSSVMAKTGATGESFEALRNKALELGRTTVFTSSQSADAMDKLAMAGWSTDKILAGTGDMLNLASAGAMDLATTADIASDIMTAFQIGAGESGRVADVLAKAATSANTSVQGLGYTMKYTAPIAQTFGMSLEETTAIGAKMADAGIKSEMAGTAMRAGLTRLAAPPKPAAEMLAKLKIDTNVKGQMRPIFDILSDIEAKFKTMTQAERIDAAKDLFGQEAMSGWLAVLTTGTGTLKEFNEQLINSGGASAEMARIMNDNIGGAFRELTSAVEGAVISIADQVKNPIRRVAEGITWLIGKFNELNPVSKGIIAAFTVMASALLLVTGPALLLLALLPSIGEGFSRISKFLGTSSSTLIRFAGAAFGVVTAITTIVLAFSFLYSKSETFRNFVDGLFSSISKTVEAAVKQITDLGKGLWGYILVWWQQDGEKIRNAAHKIIDPLKKMWNGLSDAAKPAFEEMKNVVFYVWSAIEDNFYSGLDIILGAISILADIINGDFSGAWNTLKETIDKVVNRFISAQWVTDLKDAFVSFKNDAVDYVNDAIETLTTTYEKHQGAIKTTATILGVIFGPSLILAGVRATVAGAQITTGFIAAVVKAGYEAMIAGAKIAGEFVLSLIKSGWAAVATAAKLTGWLVIALGWVALQATITAGALAGKLVVSLFQAARAGWAFNIALLANPMTWVVIGIIALIAAIVLLVKNWDTVKAKVLEVWESIKTKTSEAITAIKTTISEWINTAIQVGKDFLSGVATGFMSGIDTVVSAAKSVWERIKSVFTSEPITVSPDVQYQGPLVGPPAPRLYANGGIINTPHWVDGGRGIAGEAGPEAIIPLSASRRGRGLELWQQAGQMLGAIPYANGGLVGARSVPERQKPSKPPSGMRGAGGKGNGVRGSGPTNNNNFYISITGDQVAAMGKDEEYMRKTAREVVEEFMEEINRLVDNYTHDNLGVMME